MAEQPSHARRERCRSRAFAALLALLAGANAQSPLAEAVDACLDATTEADYATLRDALLARADSSGEALLAALTAKPEPLRGGTSFVVPFDGLRLQVQAEAPENRAADTPLPVLYAVNWSSQLLYDAVKDRAITAEVPGYEPDQFSDVARSVHVKVLNAIAYRTGGDPDALWWTGYSWGGHACWDDAMHRPGWVRGFIGRGGGPRRVSFRLLPNLVGTEVLAVCGGKDDKELVWNLREIQRTKKELGLGYTFWEPKDSGHDQPLPGEDAAGAALVATPPFGERPKSFTLLADGKDVEHPLFRVLEVDERAVSLRESIPVSSRLSADEQRRATLRSMQKHALVRVQIASVGTIKTVTLQSKGVEKGRFAFRAPWFAVGDSVRVVVGKKEVFAGQLVPDPRTLLDEVRRTGDRLRPALRVVDVAF
ncbi:MAG: hypothetical protein ABL982_14795 [Vicinamibacterales bacterium]